MTSHTPPTDQRLTELETLAKNVPAGPWTVDDSRAELLGSHGNLLADLWDDRLGAYLAAMHNAALPLIAEVRRLRAELARRVQCNDCGAVGEVFTGDDGLAYLDPSGQIGHPAAAQAAVEDA